MSESADVPSVETIGSRIKALRVGLAVTQKELAKPLGVSKAAASQWELDVAVPERTRSGVEALSKSASAGSGASQARQAPGSRGTEWRLIKLRRPAEMQP